MARKHRIHYRGAMYHIMLRGNDGNDIFFQDSDRTYFCNLMHKASLNYACKFNLFCLMANHIHMVITVDNIPISKIMQSIASSYAQHINKTHERSGHLFQGRFKDEIIPNDIYLLQVCYYIHMNPVNAGITQNINEYPWCSHHAYLQNESFEWLDINYIHEIIAEHYPGSSSTAYNNFINDYSGSEANNAPCIVTKNQQLMIKDHTKTNKTLSINDQDLNLPLQIIVETVCDVMAVKAEDIYSESRVNKTAMARNIVAYFAHYQSGYFLKDLALVFSREPENLSKSLHHFISKASQCKKILRTLHAIERKLMRIVISDPTKRGSQSRGF